MTERFSVAMCTYGGARFIGAQLESIAAQTRPPDELVVCDDRSPDETARLVERFAGSAPFPVRLHVNERNLGSTKNFERAVGLCEGGLIALCDQDDVWLPGKLELMRDAFDRAPGVGLIFTDAELVDERLRPLGRSMWEQVGFGEREQRLVRGGRALDVLLSGWTVTGATMAFRAAFKPLLRDIPLDAGMIHDGWIALVVAAVSEVDFIERRLVKYRQHPGQQVGAPGLGPGGGRAAGEAAGEGEGGREDPYGEMIRKAERLRRRLAEWRGQPGCEEAAARLDARLTHLRARARLPPAGAARLRQVARELLARRYHLYSKGFRSALKDLLA